MCKLLIEVYGENASLCNGVSPNTRRAAGTMKQNAGFLVPTAGFEPATNGLGNRCSIRAELRGHNRLTCTAGDEFLSTLHPAWIIG